MKAFGSQIQPRLIDADKFSLINNLAKKYYDVSDKLTRNSTPVLQPTPN